MAERSWIRNFIYILPLFCIFSLAVAAQEKAPPPVPLEQAFVIKELISRYSFTAEGRAGNSQEVSVKVLNTAGVDELGQITTGYNSKNETINIDYVRVIKPGGAVVVTPADKAPEVSLMIAPSAPVYSDYREKHISVAGLVPGATLEYKVTTHVTVPLAPHQFWLSHSFNKADAVLDEQLIIEVPKERQIHLKSSVYKYTTQETGSSRVYQWRTSHAIPAETNKKPKADEEAALQEDVPDVQLSTFDSWRAVAKWYDDLQKDRLLVTPEITRQAAALTKGATTDEEKARRLLQLCEPQRPLREPFVRGGKNAAALRG